MSERRARIVRLVRGPVRDGDGSDGAFTLSLTGIALGPARGHLVDLDFGPRLYRRPIVSGALAWLTSGTAVARALWPAAYWQRLAWNVRGFDPDVVDVRGLPDAGRVARRLGRLIAPIPVVASGQVEAPVESPWRRYDPSVRVSVVLPVYNGARYLSEALESCLAQTHAALELIVVDDRSTDETPAIVADFARRDRRIVALRNETNLRLPGALNAGFARATGQLLTWTSHDNLYAPTALEVMARYLCTWPDVDFVYTGFKMIDADGRVDPAPVDPPPPWYLRLHNPIGACFLYRRAVYEAIGDFRRDLEFVEDYEYWVRVYKRFTMMRLHEPLYLYRRHEESMTARARDKYEALHRRLLAEHFGSR